MNIQANPKWTCPECSEQGAMIYGQSFAGRDWAECLGCGATQNLQNVRRVNEAIANAILREKRLAAAGKLPEPEPALD